MAPDCPLHTEIRPGNNAGVPGRAQVATWQVDRRMSCRAHSSRRLVCEQLPKGDGADNITRDLLDSVRARPHKWRSNVSVVMRSRCSAEDLAQNSRLLTPVTTTRGELAQQSLQVRHAAAGATQGRERRHGRVLLIGGAGARRQGHAVRAVGCGWRRPAAADTVPDKESCVSVC